MEKQLKGIRRKSVLYKVRRDMALTLKELAVWKGVGYSEVRTNWRSQGLPIVGSYVIPSIFNLWAAGRSGSQSVNGNEAHPSPQGAGKSGESLSTHD